MKFRFIGLVLAIALVSARPLTGYSVLSHEEVIDITWESDIRPALLKRFPSASTEDLKRAHAFAYGGSVVQDVGYYPISNQKFTDMLHYVRTGDFVSWMIRDSRTLDEYAFALGALSHYVADCWGHHAINLAVPIQYPKLRAKYGDWVTYENDHDAHLGTEFSFDVLEVAKHRYNAQQYHDFIGFEVSEDLLERAFVDTYGIPMDELLNYDDLTLATFRFTVSHIIPEATQIAIATRKTQILQERPTLAKKEFIYHVSRADYKREYGDRYRRPGFFARVLGFILKVIPFGPAKVLGFKNPTPETEDLYFRSTNEAIRQYQALVHQVAAGDLRIPNRNLDTGLLTRAGEYALADQTYSMLVRRLAKDHFRHITPAVRADILQYFAQGSPANLSIKPKDWEKTQVALLELKFAHFPVSSSKRK